MPEGLDRAKVVAGLFENRRLRKHAWRFEYDSEFGGYGWRDPQAGTMHDRKAALSILRDREFYVRLKMAEPLSAKKYERIFMETYGL